MEFAEFNRMRITCFEVESYSSATTKSGVVPTKIDLYHDKWGNILPVPYLLEMLEIGMVPQQISQIPER